MAEPVKNVFLQGTPQNGWVSFGCFKGPSRKDTPIATKANRTRQKATGKAGEKSDIGNMDQAQRTLVKRRTNKSTTLVLWFSPFWLPATGFPPFPFLEPPKVAIVSMATTSQIDQLLLLGNLVSPVRWVVSLWVSLKPNTGPKKKRRAANSNPPAPHTSQALESGALPKAPGEPTGRRAPGRRSLRAFPGAPGPTFVFDPRRKIGSAKKDPKSPPPPNPPQKKTAKKKKVSGCEWV